jgi:ribosomal-protein-alanine N-acetyltransferase
MNARLPAEPVLRDMRVDDLDAVVEVERRAYAFPWTRGNFIDSLAAGYLAELLLAADGAVVGYFLAMPAVDELHLLNLTVAPAWQRRGLARRLLDVLEQRCRERGLRAIWLEVRTSNARARAVYARRGYVEAGRRPRYYPAGPAGREDAVLMRLDLAARGGDALD